MAQRDECVLESCTFVEKIRAKYADLKGELLRIRLDAPPQTGALGLMLAGNRDRDKMSVFVVGVQPDSPFVATAGGQRCIRIGDELLEVLQYISCFRFETQHRSTA